MSDDLFETNAEDVGDWFEAEAEQLKTDAEEAMTQARDETLKRAKTEVPVDTGRLRASLQADGDSVFSDVPYAPHVGLGTVHREANDYLWDPAEEEIRKALEELANS
jgi:hypothetical protein